MHRRCRQAVTRLTLCFEKHLPTRSESQFKQDTSGNMTTLLHSQQGFYSSSFVSKFLKKIKSKINNKGYFCSQKGILTTTTELFIILIQKCLVIPLSVQRRLRYLEKDGNSKIYSKGNLVTAGLIDKDLNYCLFGINQKWNKTSFLDGLPHLPVERLEQNVGFDMQISIPLLTLKTKYCVSRRYKW